MRENTIGISGPNTDCPVLEHQLTKPPLSNAQVFAPHYPHPRQVRQTMGATLDSRTNPQYVFAISSLFAFCFPPLSTQ